MLPSAPVLVDDVQQFDWTITEGQRLNLQCKADGEPKPYVLWFHDGEQVPSNDNRLKLVGPKLTIKKIKTDQAGNYACKAYNSLGFVWRNFTVNVSEIAMRDEPMRLDDLANSDESTNVSRNFAPGVKHAPFFTQNPRPQLVVRPAGSEVSLKCQSDGFPTPKITWLKGTLPPKRKSNKNITFHKWSMKLEEVTTADNGNYTCVVSNSEGSINYTFTLEIQERISHKPIIRDGYPKNLTVYVGETARFECRFISDLQPFVRWVQHFKINDSYHDEKGMPYIKTISSTDPNITNPQLLVLENTTYDEEGWYTCLAENSIGMAYRSVWLTILPWPEEVEPDIPVWTWMFLSGAGFIVLVILISVVICRYCRPKSKPITLMPQNIIIRKKIILEQHDSDSSHTSIAPLVKIDFDRSPYFSDVVPLSEYEMPLDPAWEFTRDKLVLGKPLGYGAFGQVIKGEAYGLNGVEGPTVVAVKMLKDGHIDQEMADLVSEMEVMKKIGKHVNIINLLGCCTQSGPLYVIVEYAPNGNLRDFLRAHRPSSGYEQAIGMDLKPKTLTHKNLVSFAYQIARGMEYLASKRCIHRDLAARNVLVTEDKIMKIADFGMARDINNSDYYKKRSKGRLPVKWLAPEALFNSLSTSKSDVWSYGVLLWEIMTLGGSPYPSVPHEKLLPLLQQGHRMEKPQNCSLEIYFIMRECWKDNPMHRPTFTELVEDLDRILTLTSDQEYLELNIPVLETPPSSECSSSSSDSELELEFRPTEV